MNASLLVAESLFFLVGSITLFRRERLYGIFLLLTFIYGVFGQIGYLYFPELSVSIFAYFGEETWRPVTLFIILSGVTLFLFLRYAAGSLQRLLQAKLIAHAEVTVGNTARPMQTAAFWLITTMLVAEFLIFVTNLNLINWDSAQQEDVFSTTVALGVFILLIKLSTGTNLLLYCLVRQPPKGRRSRSITCLFAVSVLLFLIFTFKLGNRTDDVAVFLGILIFETSQMRLRPKHFLAGLAISATMIVYLNYLEAQRYQSEQAEVDLVAKVLLKDYYSPAHILFAAVANDVLIPSQVITSNAGNALMFLGQPYLQAPVTDTFYPGGATRSASYGFYPFTEGYLFAGFAGFVYNGVVLGSLLVFWRSLATTNSPRFNHFLLALLGSMLVNLVRGQSSYYFKYLYTFVLPNAALYLSLSNQRLHWRPLRRTHESIAAARIDHDFSSPT